MISAGMRLCSSTSTLTATAPAQNAARSIGGNYNQDFRKMIDHVAAAGTPEEVTDKLSAFAASGVRHFIFAPASGPDGDDEVDHSQPARRRHPAGTAPYGRREQRDRVSARFDRERETASNQKRRTTWMRTHLSWTGWYRWTIT